MLTLVGATGEIEIPPHGSVTVWTQRKSNKEVKEVKISLAGTRLKVKSVTGNRKRMRITGETLVCIRPGFSGVKSTAKARIYFGSHFIL